MSVFILFLFCVLPLIIIFTFRYFSNPFKKIDPSLNLKVNYKGEAVFPYQGRDFYISYFSGSRKQQPYFKIHTQGQFGSSLLIRYETSWDKLCKSIGLNRELQITDRQANDKLYFECDDQDFLNRFFINADHKALVFTLLEKYQYIQITPKRCALKQSPAPTSIDKQDIINAADELMGIAKAASIPGGNNQEWMTYAFKQMVFTTLGVTTLTAGVVAWGWGIFFPISDPWALWQLSLNYTVPIACGVLALVFWLIKGFSTSSKTMLIVACTFTIGIILIGRFGTAVVNGYNDESETHYVDQVVIDKYIVHGKRSRSYHVKVVPWRPGQLPWTISTGETGYNKVEVNKTKYRIGTKRGNLGFEWVISEGLLYVNAPGENVSSPYWPNRDYKKWFPLPANITDISADELAYWQQWIPLMEKGIDNRLNLHEALEIERHVEVYVKFHEQYVAHQHDMLQQLSQITPPDRLKTFHEYVLQAGQDQMNFYNAYVQAKVNDPKAKPDMSNDYLKISDKKLWDAYYDFQAQYPNRTKEFNDTIERRLAWFDII